MVRRGADLDRLVRGGGNGRPRTAPQTIAFVEAPYTCRSTGRSAAWLARLLWEQEVAGSNPAAPTAQPFICIRSFDTWFGCVSPGTEPGDAAIQIPSATNATANTRDSLSPWGSTFCAKMSAAT